MATTNFPYEKQSLLDDPLNSESTDLGALNTLLRGEISAAETYGAAIDKFEGQPAVLELQCILGEHRSAAGLLRDRIRSHGGEPAVSSGMWGEFAALIAGTANVLGPKPLLIVLRRGEEHGISEYQKALNNSDMSSECVKLIESELLPRCRYHVAELQRLIDLMN